MLNFTQKVLQSYYQLDRYKLRIQLHYRDNSGRMNDVYTAIPWLPPGFENNFYIPFYFLAR